MSADYQTWLAAIFDHRELVAPLAPGPSRHGSDPFHGACYMWWDIFPSWGGAASDPAIDRACLETMEEILTIPSDLCRISALHGLNHWYPHHADETTRIVDAFLARTPDVADDVRLSARVARNGDAQ